MSLLQKIFGGSKTEKVKELLKNGALVVDVRNTSEFERAHLPGSKNIPLPEIKNKVVELKKLNQPLVLCCVSGVRSAQATSILKREGINCINGGGWKSLVGV